MTVILSLALAGLFGVTAAGKITRHSKSLEMRDHLGIPAGQWTQIGLLEAAGAAGVLLGLLLPPIGVAAGTGLALLSVGAIVAHVSNRDAFAQVVPAVFALALSIAAVVAQATSI